MKIVYMLAFALLLSACVSDKPDPLKVAARSGCFDDPVTGKFDVNGYLADPYGKKCPGYPDFK